MSLYIVAFSEHRGYQYRCRIRAATGADHITLAVQKIWGAACYWSWASESETDGRVYERLSDEPTAGDIPRTGCTSVQITPARRRPRVSQGVHKETHERHPKTVSLFMSHNAFSQSLRVYAPYRGR
jgi:hypothetical protein